MKARILFITFITMLVMAGCASKPSPNLCPTVCDGLVAYYPFYGDATDKSGNGYDLSVLEPSLSKDRNGYQNHSYYFDGKTNFLKYNSLSSWELNNKSFSLSLWLKVDKPSPTLGENWSERYLITSETRSMRIVMYYHENNSNFTFSTRKNLGAWDASSTRSKNVDYQKYYHLVGVLNREEKYLQIFINGEMHNQGLWGGEIAPSGNILYIGADHWHKGKTNLEGNIDEVRIYNRALSADEVKELYLFTSAFPPAE